MTERSRDFGQSDVGLRKPPSAHALGGVAGKGMCSQVVTDASGKCKDAGSGCGVHAGKRSSSLASVCSEGSSLGQRRDRCNELIRRFVAMILYVVKDQLGSDGDEQRVT